MKRTQITVSFKGREKWIYELLMKKSSPAAFIKDLLKDYFKGDVKK